jgi:hypothetical protein
MAIITNYATLQTAIGDYLGRSDLSGFYPNFTQNAETLIYKNLRIRAMETALSVTISSGVAAIPTSPALLELKYAYVDVSPVQVLDRVPPDMIRARWPVRSGGSIPRDIAIEGANFIFGPNPGNYTIKGIYYAQFSALSGSNTTNWFTTNAPDLLLYGSLLQAEPFIKNDPRLPVWEALFRASYDAVANEEKRQRSSGGSIATRLA